MQLFLINHLFRHMHILLSALDIVEKRSVPSLSTSVEVLEQQIKKWKSFSLVEKFDSLLDESQKSTLMIEFLEKNESHLLEEIDRVAGIYGKLEEQQNKKVFDLGQKRDQALKLQAEVNPLFRSICKTHLNFSFFFHRNRNTHRPLLL